MGVTPPSTSGAPRLRSFDFGGDGGAIPLVGDHLGGEDWVNVGTQGAWGSQQQAGAPGSAARSTLRMGRGYAREREERGLEMAGE